jgi:hypothetical protein
MEELARVRLVAWKYAAPTASVTGDAVLRYHSLKGKESQPLTDFLQQLKQHVHQEIDSILFPKQQESQTRMRAKGRARIYIGPCLIDTPPRDIAHP